MGIHPHIVTTAKALGNGIPVGAMIGRKELGTSFPAGSHGSTFGGNYIAMAAAKEVLQITKKPSFLKRSKGKGRVHITEVARGITTCRMYSKYTW